MSTPQPVPLVDLSTGKDPATFERVRAPEQPEAPWPFVVRALLVVASVALYRLALPPIGLAPLALVSTAPFLIALRGLSPREGLRVGIVYGSLGAAVNAFWFTNVFDWYFALVLWLIVGLFPALFGAGYAALQRRGGVPFAVGAPALWIALEWFRSEGWHLKFAWFTIAHALAGDAFLRQSADLAGAYGLSLFGFVVSYLIARVVLSSKKSGQALVLGIFACALPLVAYARGNRTLNFAPKFDAAPVVSGVVAGSGPGLTVLAVQDEAIRGLANNKFTLTREGVARDGTPDFILWPEDSFFSYPAEVNKRAELKAIAHLASAAFVFGSTRPAPGKREWNAAVILDPKGEQVGEYHKTVPVQFVENCLPGEGSPTFALAGTRVGVLICYDGTYPFVARRLVQNGARVLLLPTMDVADWGVTQHAHHALFYPLRACELRRSLVRAASSGVTLAVDAWGRELGRIDGMEPGSRTFRLAPNDALTFYVRGGWLLPHVCMAVTGVVLALLLVDRRPKV